MEIIPAIDIQDGACVRLYQGDFAQKTVFDPDPVAVARRWVAQGAQRLHLVDLDGAKAGHPVNTAAILGIVRAVNVPVQLGGGLRTEQAVDAALSLGVSRVIIGTAAVRDQPLLTRLVARHGPALIVGVDARDGRVALEGWTEATGIDAAEFVARVGQLGVQRVIYTDINRDGTLTEPNYAATGALVTPDGPAIIASGGLSAAHQLTRLAALGVEGVVIGKALYTGAFDMPAAMAALQRVP